MAPMLPFWKMNGLGNEILVVDARGTPARVSARAAVALAAGETAFDQIMEVSDAAPENRDATIRILNSDGSRAGACGNGMRCVALWLASETGQAAFRFEGPDGLLRAKVEGEQVTVGMGVPRFEWDQIPLAEPFHDTTGIELQIGPIDAPVLHTPSVVSMGNPHAVFWADPDAHDLARFGPLLENHPIFPDRANITIADVVSPTHIRIVTWERGAGLTRACGSAACAAAVCAARLGRAERRVTVTVPGGDLAIDWRADNHVSMTGPAAFEFAGRLDPATGAWERVPEAALQ